MRLLLFIPLMILGSNDPKTFECSETFTSNDENDNLLFSVTYDLSKLHLAGDSAANDKWYTVHDQMSQSADVKEYSFVFNVCGDTLEIPNPECCNCNDENQSNDEAVQPFSCYQDGYFDADSGTGWHPMTGPAPAWQIKYNEDDKCERCYRLGQSSQAKMQWSLLQEDEPTLGVQLTYTDGDSDDGGCYDSVTTMKHQNRELRMLFYCQETEDGSVIEPQTEVIEYETTKCLYEIQFSTLEACPIECPTYCGINSNGDETCSLCGGNGHCEIDAGLKRPHCFCNIGWEGMDCSQPNHVELALAKGTCLPIGGDRYITAVCENNRETFTATLYKDAECTQVDTSKGSNGLMQYMANKQCENFFNLGTLKAGITCVSDDAAILYTSACSSPITNGASSSSPITIFVVILLIFMLIVLAFILWQQQKLPELKNYLVLDETRGTEIQLQDEAPL